MSFFTVADYHVLILMLPLPLAPSFLSFYYYHFDISFFLIAVIHCVCSTVKV